MKDQNFVNVLMALTIQAHVTKRVFRKMSKSGTGNATNALLTKMAGQKLRQVTRETY